jgi:hypothetical protein
MPAHNTDNIGKLFVTLFAPDSYHRVTQPPHIAGPL